MHQRVSGVAWAIMGASVTVVLFAVILNAVFNVPHIGLSSLFEKLIPSLVDALLYLGVVSGGTLVVYKVITSLIGNGY